jgi:hypothetical protein
MTSYRALATLACVLGLAGPVLWLGSLVTPGEEAVKIRNGLVAEMGDASDFSWVPGDAPSTYKLNRAEPSTKFREIAETVADPGTGPRLQGMELAVALSKHLMGDPERRGGPIQSGLDDTYRGITQQRRGYCADFTRVFSGLALAAGLPVRTWSISFESFGAGHSFNEVYDEQASKWILVDPFHSLYFVDSISGGPLSVLEVHDRLVLPDGESGISLQTIVPGAMPFKSEALAIDYYRRGFRQLALVWGDNIFDYDRSKVIMAASRVSRHVERAAAIGLDVYPDLMIYPEGTSQRDVEALFRVRDRFLMAGALFLLGLGMFVLLLLKVWRERSGAGQSRALAGE